eukprot:CAMPEP_0116049650 /NCGR_PEP_ID=MMETSP0321-20121206/30283_1 /TAXON_ID=163516 /ORGANISM="Leptocylindrus danicus var. danicus, Strain B650" /LENGTH=250 /DNA_ID=CAMNT_0003532101 /DNA_START=136 /DNA_END=888 /DNA_ORIENTATION=-
MNGKISAYRRPQQTQALTTRRQMSNEIQLSTPTESIWLGDTSTCTINVKMKLGKIFFTDSSRFSLRAHLQNDEGGLFGHGDSGRNTAYAAGGGALPDQSVSFEFLARDGVSINPTVDAAGQYSSLRVLIQNKKLFAGDAFRIAVEAKEENGKEIFVGKTHIIRAVEYCVEVEGIFSSISVKVRIRNSKNQIMVPEPLQIRAILEYENGLTAPPMVNEPFNDNAKSRLFYPLSRNPFVVKPNTANTTFHFR